MASTCIDTTPTSINVSASELHSKLHLWWYAKVAVNVSVLLYSVLALLSVAYDVLDMHHDIIVALMWLLVATSAASLIMMLHDVEHRGYRLLANLRMMCSGLLDNHQSLQKIKDEVVHDMHKVHVLCVPLIRLAHREHIELPN